MKSEAYVSSMVITRRVTTAMAAMAAGRTCGAELVFAVLLLVKIYSLSGCVLLAFVLIDSQDESRRATRPVPTIQDRS